MHTDESPSELDEIRAELARHRAALERAGLLDAADPNLIDAAAAAKALAASSKGKAARKAG